MTWRDRWPALAAAVSKHPPEGSGVYFLERDGQIVYVGSSTFPSKRVFTHERCKGKHFDAVWFLPVDEPGRIDAELCWIRAMTPVHNKAWNPSPNPDYPGWGLDPNADRPVRVFGFLVDLLEEVAAEESTTLHFQVVEAVRQRLIRKGKLPPTN